MRQANFKVLKLTALALAIATTGGCITAKTNPGDKAAMAAPAPEKAVVAPMKAMAAESSAVTSYTVAKNDNLWCISKKDDIYGTAFNWPLIYKANASKIKDADLIYPGQVFDIPRDASQAEIDSAVHHAKARGAWAVGPTEASDTAYLGG
ncbi:MAG: LysM peptidoglycan-binding domain-containing protein [Arenicellales bacterium]